MPELTPITTTTDAADDVAPCDPRDRVTAEDLNVSPELLGAPLASPKRRFYAIAVDVCIVLALSNFGNMWLVAGGGLIARMFVRNPMVESYRRKVAVSVLAAVLLGAGAYQLATSPLELPHKGHKHHDDDEDVDVAKELAGTPGVSDANATKLRIAQLEGELAEARAPKSFSLKERFDDWAEDVGLGLSWAIAYFTLLPAWWNGQTLGKKLFGLRVVELTGKPITVMRAFKRYGGYAAGMATGFFGFMQVFWDPNRQAIQDKTAHTVVIDLRRKLRQHPPEVAAIHDEETP